MPIKALTLDFWDTIFKMETEMDPQKLRLDKMKSVLNYFKIDFNEEALSSLYTEVWKKFDREWREKYYTMTTYEILDFMLQKLNLTVSEEIFENLLKDFQEAILKSPPTLMENVKIEIEKLSEKYKLAIISDTGFTPGRVLREILQKNNILRHFDVLVFSDEFGKSKPHTDTFLYVSKKLGIKPEDMVHIGDNERTDVGGAISAGMKSILFIKDNNSDQTETGANAVMRNWSQIEKIISSF
jgi:HAD superfamily hydrolase (TIGR01509 family)